MQGGEVFRDDLCMLHIRMIAGQDDRGLQGCMPPTIRPSAVERFGFWLVRTSYHVPTASTGVREHYPEDDHGAANEGEERRHLTQHDP